MIRIGSLQNESIAHSLSALMTTLKKSAKNGQQQPAKRKARNASGYRPQMISAPSTVGVVVTNAPMVSFGAAAPHDDHPEGGLRIVGRLPNTSDDTLGPLGSVSTTAAFAASSGVPGGGIGFPISPTATGLGTNYPAYSMFGSTSPVAYLSTWFRRFRFRRLALIYESSLATSTSGNIQIAYDPDVPAVYNQLAFNSTQPHAATSRSMRFPIWTPNVRVPLIEEKKNCGADKLYENLAYSTPATGAKSNADLLLLYQGIVTAFHNTPGAASNVYGNYRWEFVLDLYGLANYQNDSVVTLKSGPPCMLSTPATLSSDAKESKKEAGDTDLDSPVLIKSLKDVRAAYADPSSKDKSAAPPTLSEKGPMSARGAR